MTSRTARNVTDRLLCALILFTANSQASFAEDLTPQQAVQQLADSVALVKNFDVHVELKRTQTMKLETIWRDGKRVGTRVPWPAGESPKVDRYLTHQIMDGGVNFRTEEFDPETNLPTFTLAMDDKIRMSLNFVSLPMDANIAKRSPRGSQTLLRTGQTYGTFYACLFDATPIAAVLAERKNLRHVADAASAELYVIESKPETEQQTLGWVCLRVYLDPLNGYLPARIETFAKDFDRLGSRLEILAYQTLPVGIAVPTRAKMTSFVITPSSEHVGQPDEVFEYSLDMEKSRWNCELEEGIFQIQFPPGTAVFDETKPRQPAPRAARAPPPPAAAARQDLPLGR